MHKLLCWEFFEENERKKLAIFIALEFSQKLSGCHWRLSPIASICLPIEKKEKYYYIVMILYVHSF
jgi:hypothetical protein